jgi:hypothetical protein
MKYRVGVKEDVETRVDPGGMGLADEEEPFTIVLDDLRQELERRGVAALRLFKRTQRNYSPLLNQSHETSL